MSGAHRQGARALARSSGALGLVLGALGFLPLLGGPGYEAALVAGVLVPPWAAVTAARITRFDARQGAPLFETALRGIGVGAVQALVMGLVALLHGLRVGFCEPGIEFLSLILGPGCGVVLGGLAGALTPALFVGPRAASSWRVSVQRYLAALSLPLGAVVVALLEFYFTPAVYLFSAFAGYFAGPLYEVVELPVDRLAMYRLGSLATLTTVLVVARWLDRKYGKLRFSGLGAGRANEGVREGARRGGGLRSLRVVARPDVALFVVTLATSLGLTCAGSALGHRSSAASVQEFLGGRVEHGRCVVFYQRDAIPRARAALLARECEGHLIQVGRYFEVEPPPRVDVYLFAQEGDKRRVLGIGRTYVAKPWRREIYLQEAGFPHPALGHELAHVVAGEFGLGPLRVAGSLGGLSMDPGRVEGFAVAAAPREDSDATLVEWASAMLEAERLPPLERIFQLGFFGEAAARSYTAAGAFVDFLHEKYGAGVLRDWYGGARLEALTGASWQELERDFHALLRATPPSEEVLAEAKQRFSGTAVFEQRCPHAVERLRGVAQNACGKDGERVEALVDEALELDPARIELRALVPRCYLNEGVEDRAERLARSIEDDPAQNPWIRREAAVLRGDVAWRAGDTVGARAAYERALVASPSGIGRRPLEVRLLALEREPAIQEVVRELLSSSETSAIELGLGRLWGVHPEEPLVVYLAGKGLLARGNARAALPVLERASALVEGPPSLVREAQRARLVAACQLGDEPAIRRALAAVLSSRPSPARRDEALRLAERAGVTPDQEHKLP